MQLTESTSIPSLPVELWLYICEFLSPKDRRKLLGLNRLFFELVMDELYHRLSLVSNEPWLFTETMESLMLPILSRRIRVVTFWPSAICHAIYNSVDKKRTPSSKQPQSRRDKLSRAILRLFERGGSSPEPKEPKLPSPEERLNLFLAALPFLSKIDEISIHWQQDHDRNRAACTFLPMAMKHLWQILNPNIQRLSIDAKYTKLADIIAPLTDVPQRLEHLDLKLRSDSVYPVPDIYAPFINGLADTLQSLSLTTICSGALESLGTFPRLRKLHIFTPTHTLLHPESSGLHRFLEKNATIEELGISMISGSLSRLTDSGQIHHPADILPNLHSLTFGLNRPPKDCGITLDYLGYLSRDLIFIHFRDHIQFLTDVRLVLAAFTTDKLQELYLSTKVLSPELVDLIAKKCPQLLKLSLEIDVAVAADNLLEAKLNDENGFVKNMLQRKHEAEFRGLYGNWKLQDISILQWVYKQGRQYNWELMSTIASVVLTVQSFVGQGHMRKDGLRDLEPRYLLDLGERSPVWS